MQINVPNLHESRYKSLTENNWRAWSTPALCRGFFSWQSGICVRWSISLSLRGPSPQALTLMGGVRFIAWHLRRPSWGECQRGPRHFWKCRTHLGSGSAPRPTLKKALCHTCPFGEEVKKYYLINPCFVQRLFSRLSGICAGWLISWSLFRGMPTDPRPFWNRWTHLGQDPAPGPT